MRLSFQLEYSANTQTENLISCLVLRFISILFSVDLTCNFTQQRMLCREFYLLTYQEIVSALVMAFSGRKTGFIESRGENTYNYEMLLLMDLAVNFHLRDRILFPVVFICIFHNSRRQAF